MRQTKRKEFLTSSRWKDYDHLKQMSWKTSLNGKYKKKYSNFYCKRFIRMTLCYKTEVNRFRITDPWYSNPTYLLRVLHFIAEINQYIIRPSFYDETKILINFNVVARHADFWNNETSSVVGCNIFSFKIARRNSMSNKKCFSNSTYSRSS